VDFVIACYINSCNFAVTRGSTQRERPTSLTRVLQRACAAEAKLRGTEAALSPSSARQFVGSEPAGRSHSPVIAA